MKNQINLYNKVTENDFEALGVDVQIESISYKNNDENIYFDKSLFTDNLLVLNEFDENWNPSENNININFNITIKYLQKLFGKHAVTSIGNKIGIGVRISSKTSNFQKNYQVGSFDYNTNRTVFKFNKNFEAGELKGEVTFTFYMYLEEINEIYYKHAKTSGVFLTDAPLKEFYLVIDGDNSSFPITEFSDPKGPLWKLNKYWVVAEEDYFNVSSVNIALNIKHPQFNSIKNGNTSIARVLMGEIMINSMAMIISQVLFIENSNIENVEIEQEGTILSAVKYWCETFEVNTTDSISVLNSLKQYWDNSMSEGVKK